MAFPVDDIVLGPRAYGPRKGTEMAVFHTDEGANSSKASVLTTIRMQSPGGSLYPGGGSYNFMIYDAGLILTVPYLESAGSLTSDHTPPTQLRANGTKGVWLPKDWVKAARPPAAEADTNAYIIAICFAGKAAVLSADIAAGKPYAMAMVSIAARLLRWIEQQPWGPDDINTAGHRDFQINKSDPGAGVVEKVLERYAELYNPPAPVPVPAPDYKALYEAEVARVTRLRAAWAALKTQGASDLDAIATSAAAAAKAIREKAL